MGIILGLLVAIGYGTSDFIGGVISRRIPSITVVATTSVIGPIVLALVVIIETNTSHINAPTAREWLIAAGAGIGGVIGLSLLFRGYAIGRFSVVAPITAVVATLTQILWGLARGEQPSIIALIGIVIIVVAAVIISQSHAAPDAQTEIAIAERPALKIELTIAIGAGLAFGFSGVAYAEAGSSNGIWPVLIARSVFCLAAVLIALAAGKRVIASRPNLGPALLSGLIEAVALAVFVIAIRQDFLSIVSPTAALSPAFVVLGAAALLHEPIGKIRAGGLILAHGGLLLIAVG